MTDLTDAEFAEQKARIEALAEKWIKPLGLKWWKIDISYERIPVWTEATEDMNRDGWRPQFVVHAKWQFSKATIYANLPFIAELADETVESGFLHECAHIFVNEMRQREQPDCLDHEERVCTTLANAFIWLRNALTEKEPEQITWEPWKRAEALPDGERAAYLESLKPPCLGCKHWQPTVQYGPYGEDKGKVFDGIYFCNAEMCQDFSCFRARD